WLSPKAALKVHARDELELPPPTFVTLCKLARFNCIREAMESLERREPERFTPRPVVGPSGIVSLYEGDAGYEAADVSALGRRRRLLMPNAGSWRFEDSE
ncbi:MAG: hypothetical protein KC492_29880, partial [Myxococcales bacterium]|nr:hypothetical protein [Myxococcales bacterium]